LEAAVLRFYLDENVQVAVAVELKKHGIDAVTVRDLGLLGDDDLSHLRRAAEQDRVLCTYDKDFLRLAADGVEHAGIIFGLKEIHTIGRWVNRLKNMHENYVMADMQNHVEYL